MWSSSVGGARPESFGTGIHIQTLLSVSLRASQRGKPPPCFPQRGALALTLLNLRVLELLILWVP